MSTIEKIEAYKSKEIEKAMSKLKKEYSDARRSLSDTGYDRYQKKMDKCEKEIQEIETYMHKGEVNAKDLTTDQYKEYLSMKEDIKSLNSKFFFLLSDFNLPETAEIQGMQRILEKYK